MKAVLSVLLAAGLAVICSGCSWVAMKRVPDDYQPSHRVECSSYGWPIVDTGLTSAFFIGSYVVGDSAITIIPVIIAILYAASATTGFVWSNKCHQSREAHAAWKAKPDSLQLVITDKEKKDRRRLPAWAETERKAKLPTKTVPDRYRIFCKYEPGDMVRVETKAKAVQAEFVRCDANGVQLRKRKKVGTIPFRKIWTIKKVTQAAPKIVEAKPAPATKPAVPADPEKTAAAVVKPETGPVSTTCGVFVTNGVRALWGMGTASSDHGPYTSRRLADKRARREIVEMLKRNMDVFAVMSPQGIRARVSAFTRATAKKAVIVDRWIVPEEENLYSVAVLALSECGLEPELANMLWERLWGGKQ